MLTKEQQAILSHVEATEGLTLISSIAGSGKTTMLVAIARAIPHSRGLYLAYNKSVATSSSRKFPRTTECSTTHSLAYRAVVEPYKLKLGNFSQKSISSKIHYDDRVRIVDYIRMFCLSRYVSFSDFATEHAVPPTLTSQCLYYLDLMQTASIECSHDFYLKLFHLGLASGSITYPTFDFVMLDEAGDLNEVTLEIFRLLPATRKIAVGDPHQNIYQFNHTINCFTLLKGEGTLFRMTKTFRTDAPIAQRIENFCRTYLDPEMSYTGVNLSDKTITTRAYLTRTNAALIDHMITLNAQDIPYSLVRPPFEIFKIALMLCSIKHNGFISEPQYISLQEDIDHWFDHKELHTQYKSPLLYLNALYPDDVQLTQAIRLVLRRGKALIFDTYERAKAFAASKHNYVLSTVHSCKGLEFDEVTISPDLNDSLSPIVLSLTAGRCLTELTDSEIESLNLYYVAITRCAKQLNNAIYV